MVTDTSTMGFDKRFLQHRGITVIQKLDPSLPRLRPGKVGIVLAGGAVSGGAFKAGGLRALDEVFVRRKLPGAAQAHRFGLSDFDVFVGLSAGSILASVLSAGISPDELYRILRGTSETYDKFRPWHFMRPNSFEWASRLGLFFEKEHEVLTNFLSGATDSRTGESFSLRATLGKMAQATARLLPTGLFDPHALEQYLARNMRKAGLPDDFREQYRRRGKALYLTAADLNRGELVVFGHDEPYASVPISRAIAASCAIPVWYKPMLIDNPRAGEPGEPDRLDLADGGLIKTANVRLAVEKGCELIICYNPFTRIRYDRAGRSLYEHGLPTLVSQSARTLIGARLDLAKELVYRDETLQADVVFIEPAQDDYTFFNMNPMNFWAKERASIHGYETVVTSLEANHELLSGVFRAHGIELRAPHEGRRPAVADEKLTPNLRESRG
jgi:predicted acylesterase/phospholipase RssA